MRDTRPASYYAEMLGKTFSYSAQTLPFSISELRGGLHPCSLRILFFVSAYLVGHFLPLFPILSYPRQGRLQGGLRHQVLGR